MSDVIPFQTPNQMLKKIAQLSAELEQHQLKGGDGGGTSGGMSDDWKKSVEDRLSELRTDVRDLKGDVTSLKIDIATIKENIRHMPTKPWMFGALLMLLTAVGTIITIVVRFVPHAS